MSNEGRFQPELPLRHLGYNKILGKNNPPQTLYWHCLNAYYCALTIAAHLPVPLSERERRILTWVALLHDAGKASGEWMATGRGPHVVDENVQATLRRTIANRSLAANYAVESDEEIDLIMELIAQHHTRKTLSDVDTERILSLVKLADNMVSATRIDTAMIDRINRFLAPRYIGVVLSAEEHPISYYALSHADLVA
ncbi:MAG: HD domain-containing protein, partial [Thermoplasmata archaeon]